MTTEHVYEIYTVGPVGRFRDFNGPWTSCEAAMKRLEYLRAAHAANGFGGRAWMTRDGEKYEPISMVRDEEGNP